MQTTPLDRIPASLGAWDAMVQRSREQNAANRAAIADSRERREQLRAALSDALSEGDVGAPALFAKQRRNRNVANAPAFRAPSVAEVTCDALMSTKQLQRRMVQLLVDAALGMDVESDAKALVRDAAERFADEECDE